MAAQYQIEAGRPEVKVVDRLEVEVAQQEAEVVRQEVEVAPQKVGVDQVK